MKPTRRTLLGLIAGAAALPAVPRIAWAQSYPARPVHLLVGFAAGGGADIVARLIGQWLSERLGQPFIIENRPGAGTNIATEVVVNASPDGYTLLLAGLPNASNESLFEKLPFNFISDIAPIARIDQSPLVMVVNSSIPARTVPEFIAYAKANPGKVTMASAGTGSVSHLAGELFKMMAALDLVHVPYRGGAPAVADLLGGRVQTMFIPVTVSIALIKAGKLRALAITSSKRIEVLPDIATVGEFLPGYEASAWYGIGAPKKTPTQIIEKLNAAVNAAIVDEKLKARLADLGGTAAHPGSPTDFGQLIADETEKWGKVIRTANIKME